MDEPAQDALGFLLVSRRSGEPVRLASHRVDPGVDQHLEGPAPLANVPAWSSPSGQSHGQRSTATIGGGSQRPGNTGLEMAPPTGLEPVTLRLTAGRSTPN